jgi:NADPH2:quinone reductase
MKSIMCQQFGSLELLKLEEVPSPAPNASEVLVEVYASGVSFPDVLMVLGKYQTKQELPFTPGLEMAGVIKSVGEDVVGFKPGDWIFGRATRCLAEELVTIPDFLWRLPKQVDCKVAAGFSLNYGTSWYALQNRARLQPGETLLVLGASGGVGIAAVELGKILGAKVIACASSETKLAVCRSKGADQTINYETENIREAIKYLTNNRGVDVVFDPVGGRFADPAIRSLAWGGRYLIVGFAAGEISKLSLNLPLLKGATILGVWWGGLMKADRAMAHELMQQLVDYLAEGRIQPSIMGEYPLANAYDALNDLAHRKTTGKVIIDIKA